MDKGSFFCNRKIRMPAYQFTCLWYAGRQAGVAVLEWFGFFHYLYKQSVTLD